MLDRLRATPASLEDVFHSVVRSSPTTTPTSTEGASLLLVWTAVCVGLARCTWRWERLAERGRPEAAAEALAVRELAQSSLAEVRRPGHRARRGRALLTSTGAACELRVDDAAAAALPFAAQEALAWAVREAVTNVVLHASARTCSVSLAVVDGAAVLVVRNDGADVGVSLRPGAGLTGLRGRLADRGGALDVRHDGPRVELVATGPADDHRRTPLLPPLEGASR